jgi:pimeloyl-ACP methyl ester carboxylesterase
MISRALLLSLILAVPLAVSAGSVPPSGLQTGVVFAAFPPYAHNGELLRRLVSPLNARRILEKLAPSAAGAIPLDPARQRFVLYVPAGTPPPAGYALLVFVPPWDDARVPPAWIAGLDRQHMIFVSATHSGNDADVLNRREPLALLAAYGVMQHYHVDPSHVYVGGFSGGARVAQRLALGYPDVFRGALLDAGSDPIGTAQIPLPPADLMDRFQRSTRLVFVAGSDDDGTDTGNSAIIGPDTQQQRVATNLYEQERNGFGLTLIRGVNGLDRHRNPDDRSEQSLQDWCVRDFETEVLHGVGHELADAPAFERALRLLTSPASPDAGKLASCRAKIDGRMRAQLQRVQSLLEEGKRDDARALLAGIDAEFGGLAAPRSIALMDKIDAGR